MIDWLLVNKSQMCHRCASSLLFMPNGCNVLALFISWASRAFLTEPVTFATYEFNRDEVDIVNRMASLVEVLWYWCSCAELLVRTSVFPKAFIELTLGLSNVLKVALFTFHQVYEIFWVARYGVGDFSSFICCNSKSIICLAISEKKASEVPHLLFMSCP